MARYGEIAARLGATGPASVIYDKLLPYRDQIVTSVFTVTGSVERTSACWPRRSSAGRTPSSTSPPRPRPRARGCEAVPGPHLAELGGALLARGEAGDADRGRELIERAVELAREHGSGAIVRDAEALIAHHAGA